MASLLGSIISLQKTWSRRYHDRGQLMTWVQMDPRTLQDMGIAYNDAWHEARKPFWKA